MADIINLRQARKTKARKQKEVKAAENRSRHGVSKSIKKADQMEASILKAQLDGHQLNSAPPAPKPEKSK